MIGTKKVWRPKLKSTKKSQKKIVLSENNIFGSRNIINGQQSIEIIVWKRNALGVVNWVKSICNIVLYARPVRPLTF